MKTSIKYLSVVTAALLASSCATKAPPSSSIANTVQFAAIKSNQSALVSLDVSGQRCERTNIRLRNTDTDKKYTLSVIQKRGRGIRGLSLGEPALVSLDAGTYEIFSGVCLNNGFKPINYTWIDRWFEPFELKNGDVRYLGSLSVTAAKGLGKQTTANEVVTRLANWGFNDNKTVQYPVFKFIDLKSRAKTALNLNYPELASSLTYQPPTAKLTAKEFRDVVQKAFADDADGKQRLKKDAIEDIKTYMDTFKN